MRLNIEEILPNIRNLDQPLNQSYTSQGSKTIFSALLPLADFYGIFKNGIADLKHLNVEDHEIILNLYNRLDQEFEKGMKEENLLIVLDVIKSIITNKEFRTYFNLIDRLLSLLTTANSLKTINKILKILYTQFSENFNTIKTKFEKIDLLKLLSHMKYFFEHFNVLNNCHISLQDTFLSNNIELKRKIVFLYPNQDALPYQENNCPIHQNSTEFTFQIPEIIEGETIKEKAKNLINEKNLNIVENSPLFDKICFRIRLVTDPDAHTIIKSVCNALSVNIIMYNCLSNTYNGMIGDICSASCFDYKRLVEEIFSLLVEKRSVQFQCDVLQIVALACTYDNLVFKEFINRSSTYTNFFQTALNDINSRKISIDNKIVVYPELLPKATALSDEFLCTFLEFFKFQIGKTLQDEDGINQSYLNSFASACVHILNSRPKDNISLYSYNATKTALSVLSALSSIPEFLKDLDFHKVIMNRLNFELETNFTLFEPLSIVPDDFDTREQDTLCKANHEDKFQLVKSLLKLIHRMLHSRLFYERTNNTQVWSQFSENFSFATLPHSILFEEILGEIAVILGYYMLDERTKIPKILESGIAKTILEMILKKNENAELILNGILMIEALTNHSDGLDFISKNQYFQVYTQTFFTHSFNSKQVGSFSNFLNIISQRTTELQVYTEKFIIEQIKDSLNQTLDHKIKLLRFYFSLFLHQYHCIRKLCQQEFMKLFNTLAGSVARYLNLNWFSMQYTNIVNESKRGLCDLSTGIYEMLKDCIYNLKKEYENKGSMEEFQIPGKVFAIINKEPIDEEAKVALFLRMLKASFYRNDSLSQKSFNEISQLWNILLEREIKFGVKSIVFDNLKNLFISAYTTASNNGIRGNHRSKWVFPYIGNIIASTIKLIAEDSTNLQFKEILIKYLAEIVRDIIKVNERYKYFDGNLHAKLFEEDSYIFLSSIVLLSLDSKNTEFIENVKELTNFLLFTNLSSTIEIEKNIQTKQLLNYLRISNLSTAKKIIGLYIVKKEAASPVIESIILEIPKLLVKQQINRPSNMNRRYNFGGDDNEQIDYFSGHMESLTEGVTNRLLGMGFTQSQIENALDNIEFPEEHLLIEYILTQPQPPIQDQTDITSFLGRSRSVNRDAKDDQNKKFDKKLQPLNDKDYENQFQKEISMIIDLMIKDLSKFIFSDRNSVPELFSLLDTENKNYYSGILLDKILKSLQTEELEEDNLILLISIGRRLSMKGKMPIDAYSTLIKKQVLNPKKYQHFDLILKEIWLSFDSNEMTKDHFNNLILPSCTFLSKMDPIKDIQVCQILLSSILKIIKKEPELIKSVGDEIIPQFLKFQVEFPAKFNFKDLEKDFSEMINFSLSCVEELRSIAIKNIILRAFAYSQNSQISIQTIVKLLKVHPPEITKEIISSLCQKQSESSDLVSLKSNCDKFIDASLWKPKSIVSKIVSLLLDAGLKDKKLSLIKRDKSDANGHLVGHLFQKDSLHRILADIISKFPFVIPNIIRSDKHVMESAMESCFSAGKLFIELCLDHEASWLFTNQKDVLISIAMKERKKMVNFFAKNFENCLESDLSQTKNMLRYFTLSYVFLQICQIKRIVKIKELQQFVKIFAKFLDSFKIQDYYGLEKTIQLILAPLSVLIQYSLHSDSDKILKVEDQFVKGKVYKPQGIFIHSFERLILLNQIEEDKPRNRNRLERYSDNLMRLIENQNQEEAEQDLLFQEEDGPEEDEFDDDIEEENEIIHDEDGDEDDEDEHHENEMEIEEHDYSQGEYLSYDGEELNVGVQHMQHNHPHEEDDDEEEENIFLDNNIHPHQSLVQDVLGFQSENISREILNNRLIDPMRAFTNYQNNRRDPKCDPELSKLMLETKDMIIGLWKNLNMQEQTMYEEIKTQEINPVEDFDPNIRFERIDDAFENIVNQRLRGRNLDNIRFMFSVDSLLSRSNDIGTREVNNHDFNSILSSLPIAAIPEPQETQMDVEIQENPILMQNPELPGNLRISEIEQSLFNVNPDNLNIQAENEIIPGITNPIENQMIEVEDEEEKKEDNEANQIPENENNINFVELGLPANFLEINGIDESTFNALPDDLRMDIIIQYNGGVLPRRQAEGGNQENQGGQDMDNATFIASLPPDLRTEVLLTSTPDFLNTLPAELLAEAQALRQSAASRLQRMPISLGGGNIRDVFSRIFENPIQIAQNIENQKIKRTSDCVKLVQEEIFLLPFLRFVYLDRKMFRECPFGLLQALAYNSKNEEILIKELLALSSGERDTHIIEKYGISNDKKASEREIRLRALFVIFQISRNSLKNVEIRNKVIGLLELVENDNICCNLISHILSKFSARIEKNSPPPENISEDLCKLLSSAVTYSKQEDATIKRLSEFICYLCRNSSTAQYFNQQLEINILILAKDCEKTLSESFDQIKANPSSFSFEKENNKDRHLIRMLGLLQKISEISENKAENKIILNTLITNPALCSLWHLVSEYLGIMGNKMTLNSLLFQRLIPLLESFFSLCSLIHESREEKDKEDKSNEGKIRRKISFMDEDEQKENLDIVDKLLNQISQKNQKIINLLAKNNPQVLNESLSIVVKKMPQTLDFENKRRYFKEELKKLKGREHQNSIRLKIRRNSIFMDSYHQLRHLKDYEMKGRLVIEFVGEEAQDVGGVTREWFLVLSRELFNHNYALFRPAGNKVSHHPSENSYINPDHLTFFKFVGKCIGKALFDGYMLDCYFTKSFYKHMLGMPLCFMDYEDIDPDHFKNLQWILENDISDIDITFSYEANEFGRIMTRDLIPNGRNIAVTEENKTEYVKAYVYAKMAKSVESQVNNFLEGFHELIPPNLIKIFNSREIELMLSGLPDIEIDDLKNNTDYNGYNLNSPSIQWLWEIVEEFDKEDKAAFVQFVTGTSKVPIDGFKGLRGMHGLQKFQIHKSFDNKKLPSAHTCFNQLDLPEYETKDILKEKLLISIREGREGFGFI